MKEQYLITGGAGFIGSHLCQFLVNQGNNVVAIDNLSTGRIENIASLIGKPGFQFVRESITNQLVLDRLSSESSTIIHLAAAVGVQLIVRDPVHTIRTNVMGTESVLTTANRYGCRVLIASTSEVYGKGVKVPFREDDDRLMGPTTHSRWSYAASKAIDEFLGLAYQRQFGLPITVVRLFNTVGPRQSGQYGMVVPRFVRQALTNQPVTIFGDGHQTRCFADVEDVVAALNELLHHPGSVGEVFNIGSTEEITVIELAERVISLTGSQSKLTFIPYDKAYEPGFEDMMRRVPSIEKIHNLTGFIPKNTLDQLLQRVIEYEKQQLSLLPTDQ